MTNPERVMYAEPRVTKLDLARYYVAIADWIMPHVVDRPMSLLRCPDGQGSKSFFQKHPGVGTPEALHRVRIDGQEYLTVPDLAGLVSLVQIGVLELHPWGARIDKVERPDRVIFDLDPSEDVPWRHVIEAAWRLRELLHQSGLTSFVKTTGGKGLHIVVPVDRRQEWTQAKQFTQAVAQRLVADDPRRYTVSPVKQARQGRIYIDCNRNSRGATAVAAYSTRNHPRATVSVPLNWAELSEEIGPDHFTVHNLVSRLSELSTDPWADLAHVRQSLTAKVWRSVRR
jgi:bifunctional non-homologous end joining protein LigD